MKLDNKANKIASGPTSDAAPVGAMSSAEYLRRQSKDAESAAKETLADLQHDFGRATDPRVWVRAFPWASVGMATVSGFALASTMLAPQGNEANAEPSGQSNLPMDSKGKTRSGATAPSPEHEHSNLAAALTTGLFELAKLFMLNMMSTAAQNNEANHPAGSEREASAHV